MELFWRSLLADNMLLFKFLGVYVLLHFTSTLAEAARVGLLVGVGMVLTSWLTWVVDHYVFMPAYLRVLQDWVFVLIVLGVALVLAKIKGHKGPDFWKSGLLNTAVLGLVIMNARAGYPAVSTFLVSAGSTLGLLLVLILMGSIMESMETQHVPKPLQGAPIRLILMGVLALGFMGFRLPV